MRQALLWPAIAIAISLAIVLAIFGPGIANPHDVSWIQNEAVTTQFGWQQFRTDPAHIYPMVTNRYSWPLPMPVAIFDTIPIVSLAMKLLSPLLPPQFQYFGPVFVLGVALQALIAWACLREVTPGKSGLAYQVSLVIGAVFFASAPVLIVRFYYSHLSLSLQWPIVLSLLIYLRSFRQSYWRSIGEYSLLAFLAAGINPYMMVMATLVYGGFIVKCLLGRTLQWQHYVFLVIPLFSAIAGLVLFGFLPLDGSGVFKVTGYGLFSTNALSLIDPMSRFLGSAFLPDQALATPGQYEGFGYLGAGVMFILAAAAVTAFVHRRGAGGDGRRIYLPLGAVLLVSFALALSHVMTFGAHLAELPIPGALLEIMQNFRSSGRLIWVVVYVLMFIGISVLIRQLRPERAALVLGLAAMLQVADLAAPLARLHQHFTTRFLVEGIAERFADPAYQGLGRAHDLLLVVPAWQCRTWRLPKEDYPVTAFMRFSNLAMDNGLATNSFYGGRTPVNQAFYHCETFLEKLVAEPAGRRTVYLLTPRAFGLYGAHVAESHACDLAEGMFICRADGKGPGLTPRAQQQVPPLRQSPP